MSAARPLFPQEQTFAGTHRTSVSCQSRPSAPQQTTALLDHFGRWQAALIGSSDRIDFAIWRLMTNSNLNVLRASRFLRAFSAEKKKEYQSQQKRNDQETSNLVCR